MNLFGFPEVPKTPSDDENEIDDGVDGSGSETEEKSPEIIIQKILDELPVP